MHRNKRKWSVNPENAKWRYSIFFLWRGEIKIMHSLNDKIHVWYIDKKKHLPFQEEKNAILSQEEKKRAQQFYFEEDRLSFIIYHACKRFILSQYLLKKPNELIFSKKENGKPILIPQILYFNLSHTHNLGILAITKDKEIGIDIENTKREMDYLNIAKRFFHAIEYESLIKLANNEQRKKYFYRLWTAKEAILKATGEGLSEKLNQVYISEYPYSHSLENKISLISLDAPENYIASLAIIGEKKEIECFFF